MIWYKEGMTSTKENTKQDWREYRRLRVWEMHQQGYKQSDIATALGLSQGGVSHILTRAREGGEEALRQRKPKGVQARLTAEQKAELLTKLEQGAEAHGYVGDVWTTARIAELIQRDYGVRYHPDYIGPLLRAWGWSVQRPVVRATQRNEEAIAVWRNERWPALEKKPKPKGTRSSS
jgi:transposase